MSAVTRFVRTLSGSDTIMWQSINASGTCFRTDSMAGGPITILETKCPSITSTVCYQHAFGPWCHIHTHMEPVSTTTYHAITFVAEISQVRSQQARRHFDRRHGFSCFFFIVPRELEILGTGVIINACTLGTGQKKAGQVSK